MIRFQAATRNKVVSYAEVANMPQPGGRDGIENLSSPIRIFKEQVLESREVQGKEQWNCWDYSIRARASRCTDAQMKRAEGP